jgi:endonuclease/exonuclease/phosphatase family metal-dependent hydrolase
VNDVVEFLATQQADIVCLQEFFIKTTDTVNVLGEIARRLNLEHYFFRNYYQASNGRHVDALITFSKYPIVRTGYFQNDNKSTSSTFIDISIDGEIIRVFNIHLESFQFGKEDYTFYSNLKEAETEKTPIKEGTMKIMKKLRRAYELRAKQVDILSRFLKNSPYPVLICGDLNDTPSSYTLQVMSRGMYDSFRRAGRGFLGDTYRGNLPSYRIDYILLDDDFEAYDYQTTDIGLSDHYPISTYINIHPAK